MSTQVQKPGIMPSLADLDKEDTTTQQQQQQQQSQQQATDDNGNKGGDNLLGPGKNPTTTPSPGADGNKPGDGDNREDDEGDNTEDQNTDDNGNGANPGDDGSDVDPMAFWNEVTQLRGDDMKWEFPNDVDPTTPAGVHHAIKAAEDRAVDRFEQYLMKKDPRAYAYMLHRDNGGNDEDFFKAKTEPLPDQELLKSSVDLQQSFYKRALVRKGIEPEQADLIIKDAVEKNKLLKIVEAEYKQQEEAQKKQLEDLLRKDEENRRIEKEYVDKMGVKLQQHILENKGLNITIPDAKRQGFMQFVNSVLYFDRESRKFLVSQELSNETLPTVLEALYYLHVGGNLDDIIARKAATKNVQNLKLKMQKDKRSASAVNPNNNSTQNKPGIMPALSEL